MQGEFNMWKDKELGHNGVGPWATMQLWLEKKKGVRLNKEIFREILDRIKSRLAFLNINTIEFWAPNLFVAEGYPMNFILFASFSDLATTHEGHTPYLWQWKVSPGYFKMSLGGHGLLVKSQWSWPTPCILPEQRLSIRGVSH